MPNTAIVNVDVNDEQFKKFLELYDGFHAKLEGIPNEWAKVDKASHAAFNSIAAAMLTQNALIADALKGQKDLGEESNKAATSWEKLSRSTKDAAKNIVGAAKSLAAWVGVSTIVSGLLGAGSLFGLDRLGLSISAGRRSSAGLGVSYGQQQSFGLNFGRFVDPHAVLGAVSTGLFDVTSPEYLALLRAGVSQNALNKGNAADIGAELLAKIPQVFGKVPANQRGMMANVLGYSQLGIGAEEINRYLNASPEERARQQSAYRADAQGLNQSGEQQRAWNDFTTQLERAGKSIENSLARPLTELLPGLNDLSKGFAEAAKAFLGSDTVKQWMKDLGEGLKWLGEYFKSPAFKSDVEEFARELGELTRAIGKVASFVIGLFPKAPEFPQSGGGAFGSWRMGKGRMEYDAAVGAPRWFSQEELDGVKPGGSQAPGFGGPAGSPGFNPISYRTTGPSGGLLDRISYTESRGNPYAVSPKGAMGEFQFMPKTWDQYGEGGDPFNPQDSRAAAGRYMKDLLAEFHGDLREAVAAYNWGPGNVERDIKQRGADWESGLPPETKQYLQKVLGGGPTQTARQQAPDPTPSITIHNNTGGSAIINASGLAV